MSRPLCQKVGAVHRNRTTDIQNMETTTTITTSACLQQDFQVPRHRLPGMVPEGGRSGTGSVLWAWEACAAASHRSRRNTEPGLAIFMPLSSSSRPMGMRKAGDSYLDF